VRLIRSLGSSIDLLGTKKAETALSTSPLVTSETERLPADPEELIRILRAELQAKDERIMTLMEESAKYKELNKHGVEQMEGKKSGPFNDKKKKEAIIPELGPSGDSSDLARLKNTLKKVEEQRELLSIEKDQLELDMKEKSQEAESLKGKLRNATRATQDMHDLYLSEYRTLKDLNSKVKMVASSLPSSEELKGWKGKLEDLSKENDRLRKEMKSSASARSGTKSVKKSVSKDPKGSVSPGGLEGVKNLLQISVEQMEKFSGQYVKDLTNEYLILELEYEEFRRASQSEMRRLETELLHQRRLNQQLTSQTQALKAQQETLIIDMYPVPQRPPSPSNAHSTIFLGRSPAPRGEISIENTPNHELESHPRKKLVNVESRPKEILHSEPKLAGRQAPRQHK